MRVLHSGTLDVNAGGPAMSTYYTLYGLRELGVDAEIVQYPLSEGGRMRGTEIPVHFISHQPIERKFYYSPYYCREVKALGTYDIYHAQGVWTWTTYGLIDIARKLKRPYIITPRGMLYPQDIEKANTAIKKLSLKLRLLRDLNRAACVQVTCDDEMNYCRELGVTAPIAVIVNPVDDTEAKCTKSDGVRRIGYLGRISKRKNVESLIYAFAELGNEAKTSELLIIGGGDKDYEAFLRKEVSRLSLQNVHFTGFLSGYEKDRAIASCSVLAMPSEFENLGNVILEGLVRGIPCVATKGAPWSDLEKYQCGWWIEYNQSSITNAIKQAIEISDNDLYSMGERGKKLIKEKYSIASVASRMKCLYEWIESKSERPLFVFLD